jgi:integrase
MAIYQRGKNWYIDFTFHGQRIREMIGPSRKGAEKVIAKRKTEIIENKFLDIRKEPDPVKFHDFAKEYLQWDKANKKPSTYSRDLYTMRIFDKEFEGKNIQELTTWQIEKYKTKRKEKFNCATVNRELAVLKHMFTKAIEWGKLKENPAKKVKLLKGAVNRVRYLMPEEYQLLLSNCEDFLKPIVTLAVHTGMRRGELLGLQWDQVNIEQGIITILDTKNHERKDIPINETVKETIKGMKKDGDFIFPGKNGKPFSPMKLHFSFHRAMEASNITDFRFHDLRHTFASNLVMAGVKIEKVQKLMGHKLLTMTQKYSHLAPGYLSESVKVLDRVMSQNPPQVGKVIQLSVQNG